MVNSRVFWRLAEPGRFPWRFSLWDGSGCGAFSVLGPDRRTRGQPFEASDLGPQLCDLRLLLLDDLQQHFHQRCSFLRWHLDAADLDGFLSFHDPIGNTKTASRVKISFPGLLRSYVSYL